MKIAFRKTNAPGFFPGLFNRYTKWSLKTDYAHGGVVIGGQLWHTTTRGLQPESLTALDDWDLFETPVSDSIGLARIKQYQGIRYDAISLLGFKLPIRIRDSRALYCYEVLWLALTGENPSRPISPDTIMAQLLRLLNAESSTNGNSLVTDDDGDRLRHDSDGCKT